VADDEVKDVRTLEALLAATLVAARARRDEPNRVGGPVVSKRALALVVTNIEQAALWLCEHNAREHSGEDALLDWLLQAR
jgi:hypothetical protein